MTCHNIAQQLIKQIEIEYYLLELKKYTSA